MLSPITRQLRGSNFSRSPPDVCTHQGREVGATSLWPLRSTSSYMRVMVHQRASAPTSRFFRCHSPTSDNYLRVAVTWKQEDLRGAIWLASSDSFITESGEDTYLAFLDKHSPSAPEYSPHSPVDLTPSRVAELEVARSISSFPLGSTVGPNGLCPQHQNMLSAFPPDSPHSLFLTVLAAFSSLVLEGYTHPVLRRFFFDAHLIALNKRDGGVRPIALGCVLRRLLAEIACYRVSVDMSGYFSPLQLGFGVKGGVEAAVHARHNILNHISFEDSVAKLDFCNAFNKVRRDCMLQTTLDVCPSFFPMVFSAYSVSFSLFWEQCVLNSSEGVQQRDSLGPLLFCIVLDRFLVPL
uniref:Uncharacterized protein n=1 Tax=Amphimedon queenslandica TaxID=400682 RepID=A0A1X7UJ43_AMPQE